MSRFKRYGISIGALAGIAAVAALTFAGCGGDANGSSNGGSGEIPQPALKDPRVAPESQRVDLKTPTFSNPTDVTNPLFPISKQESVLQLGKVDGEPFRTEVTLLPETRIIDWEGQRVEVAVSQYAAYLSGRLHEVAYDFYAQDDEGNVWYFGEDVFNFKDGFMADTHGTWIAGKDGPAAMIMPADPQVGDVYRPENIPGLVFEEVTVKATDQTLVGPLGPVEGGLKIEEIHLLDNSREEKTFGPGYGEFLTGGGGDLEAISLAVPTDRLDEPTPPELTTLQNGAVEIYGGAKAGKAAKPTVEQLNAAWETVSGGAVPNNLEPLMTASLQALTKAVEEGNQAEAAQAAIEVARLSLDLQLRHQPAVEIDLGRFDLWAAQMLLDAQAKDAAAMNGDFFTIDYIRDRVIASLDPADQLEINTTLEELTGAVGDEDFAAATEAATQLREQLAGLKPAS
jgi:hypothetical protein